MQRRDIITHKRYNMPQTTAPVTVLGCTTQVPTEAPIDRGRKKKRETCWSSRDLGRRFLTSRNPKGLSLGEERKKRKADM